MIEVRRAREGDDLRAIGDIYVRSWQAAYQGLVPQEFLDALSVDRWVGAFEKGMNPACLLIEDGRFIGTSSLRSGRDAGMEDMGEIVSIYLLPEYYGRGLGRMLIDAVEAELRKMGFEMLYLWVLRDNARARRFYEKAGFVPSGDERTIEIGGAALEEVRYVKAR